MSRILIVDDDVALCRSLEIQLREEGHDVAWAGDGRAGLEKLRESAPDLMLLDLALPDENGLNVLRKALKLNPDLAVAMITGQQDMRATIEAMRIGAFDYIRKPFDMDELLIVIEKAERRRQVADTAKMPVAAVTDRPDEIIGADRRIVEVVKQIGLLSQSRIPVLIEGETGTGKELVARALHESDSPGEPFVAVNCSAVVPTLLESEMFGHEKGAFTGAGERKIGKLEHAKAGTVFLDEIGDMSLDLQAKLLRVLEQREFERVGGLKSIPFHARVVAATHRDLEAMVRDETFREDLYYRLAVSRIKIPPLRERRGDIPLLARHLISRAATTIHKPVSGLEEKALRRLQQYDWPGNVRELQNVLTRAVALARSAVITVDDLEFTIGARTPVAEPSEIVPLHEAEKRYIEKALLAGDWNITRTAELLEISPTTLRKKISDYNLRRP